MVEALNLWPQAAFFGLLLEGRTLADSLKAKYTIWNQLDSFVNKDPEMPANDILYWGRKILL
jgi:hypothetical protein